MREVLERDQEFTVEPYGVEMTKVMSPHHNGGFNTFVLSTDDNAVYEPDKRLLTAVCNRADAERITDIMHEECVRRVGAAVAAARTSGHRQSTSSRPSLATCRSPSATGISGFPSPHGQEPSSSPPRR